jgi:hypothetical protein
MKDYLIYYRSFKRIEYLSFIYKYKEDVILVQFSKVKNTEGSELEILENWPATVEDSNLEYFKLFSFISLEGHIKRNN